MNELLNKINTALGGKVYFGFYPGDPAADHIVATALNTSTQLETDDGRLWEKNTVQVSIFTRAANIFARGEAAASALEAAGLFIEQRSYFLIDDAMVHQYDILVSLGDFA